MKKISDIVFFICLLLLGGIADGLNQGASLSSALWSLPIILVMWVSVKTA